MGASKTAPWIAGTVVAALLLVAGMWLLGISPRLTSAADAEDGVTAAQARMDQLEIQLAGLERDFRNIEDLRTQRDELQVEIPSSIHLADLTREVSNLAQQAQIFVVAVNPGIPVSVVPIAPVAPAPTDPAAGENAGEGDGSTTEGDGTADAPATAGPQTIAGYYAVPFEIVVLGPYAQTVDFIARLQASPARLLVVTGISATAQEPAGAQSGRPAIAAGDLETSVKGYAYVLLDSSGTAPADGEPVEPEPMPVPGVADNPFAPAT